MAAESLAKCYRNRSVVDFMTTSSKRSQDEMIENELKAHLSKELSFQVPSTDVSYRHNSCSLLPAMIQSLPDSSDASVFITTYLVDANVANSGYY